MACPRMCWAKDNEEHAENVAPSPSLERPNSAVGNTPIRCVYCRLCGRTWAYWSRRDGLGRMSARWYVASKQKIEESSLGIQQQG